MARYGTGRSAGRRRSPQHVKPYNDDYKDDLYREDDREDDPDDDWDVRTDREYGRSYREESYGQDPYAQPGRTPEGSSTRPRSYSEGSSRSRRSAGETSSRSRRPQEEPRDRRYGDRSGRRESESRRRETNGRTSREGTDRRGDSYEDRPRGRRRGRGCGCCLVPLICLIVLVVGAVAALGSLWGRVDSARFRSSDIRVNDDLPDSVVRSTKNYRTIMIFGVDARDNTTLQEGTLADSNVILSINRRTGEVRMVSLYRDSYVRTTEGDWMKLTEVYSRYGAKEQLQTINMNYDMNVTEYVTVNWKAVAETINELDGIDVELTSDEAQSINQYIDEVINSTGIDSSYVSVENGTQHLDGVQAVTYCRLRKGLGDDYKRTERQRTVISLTLAKAQKAGIPKVLSVCSTVFPGLSSSLSLTQILSMALGMGRYDIVDSTGFPFEIASQDGGNYYLFPNTLASNTKELHAYLYDDTEYEPSGTVTELSSAISSYSGYYGN